MHAIKIEVDPDDGDILISDGDESNTVRLHHEQLPLLKAWLDGAAKKAAEVCEGLEAE